MNTAQWICIPPIVVSGIENQGEGLGTEPGYVGCMSLQLQYFATQEGG